MRAAVPCLYASFKRLRRGRRGLIARRTLVIARALSLSKLNDTFRGLNDEPGIAPGRRNDNDRYGQEGKREQT